jgi:hypothetical protein
MLTTVHPVLPIDTQEEPMNGDGLQPLRTEPVSVPIIGSRDGDYPIRIEMLLGVPDAGLLLGKADRDGRFFRHVPAQAGTTLEEHPPGVSHGVGAAWGREVYVSGYPGSGL